MSISRSTVLALACVLSLLALPALGEEQVIYSGVDLWHTPDDGSTLIFFAENPIPADFFCSGSRPFTGRVALKGVPLATSPPGAFGDADTIMERLDDAVFDDNGLARTRIQFRALSLVSIDPIETVCGPFNLSVYLTGEQPISEEMTIVREGPEGGYFMARFGGSFRLSFTPTRGIWKNRLDLELSTKLSGSTHSWTYEPGEGGFENKSYVMVDTDGDRDPDTFLPGTSNFAAGWSRKAADAVPVMELKLSSGCEYELEHKVSPVRPAEFVPPFPYKACSASTECPSGTCPPLLTCEDEIPPPSCSAGSDWVECNGNRTYCSSCSTICCAHYLACDKWCPGGIGACINKCCVCAN